MGTKLLAMLDVVVCGLELAVFVVVRDVSDRSVLRIPDPNVLMYENEDTDHG